MTPEEIDNMQAGLELDELVEIALGNAVISHLPFVYMEDWTEDGTDGWSGMVCPRCLSSEKEGKCIKFYSASYRHIRELLEWILDNTGDLFIERWKDPKDNMWFLCNLAQPVRKLPYNQKLAIAATSDKVADDELPNLPLALCRYILKVQLAKDKQV